MFCYLVLIVNIVFFIWCGILVHKIEKDPEYQKWKQFADGMNEVTRLIKEAKYYAKKSNESLKKFIELADKDGLIKSKDYGNETKESNCPSRTAR